MFPRPLAAVLLAATTLLACSQQPETSAPPPMAAAGAGPAAVPGATRFQVGEARVTALADGTGQLSTDIFQGAPAAEFERLLRAAGDEPPPDAWVNTFLVEVGGRRVLIDTGAGAAFGPGAGKLFDVMSAAGIDPASIQAVVISHSHGDHVGGLIDGEGRARFPGATVHMHVDEAAFWTAGARSTETARRVTAAYGDRFRPFRGPTEIAPGLSAEPVVGHTPGHTVYRLRSGAGEMVFIGDMIHSVAIQAPRPATTVTFDNDQAAARAARLAFLRANARDGVLFAGPHFPYPGVARFVPNGEGYRYAPAPPGPAGS